MNVPSYLTLGSDGEENFLENKSFLATVPDGFAVKSFASVKVAVDPQIDFGKLIGSIDGHRLERIHYNEGHDEAVLSTPKYYVFSHFRKGHVTVKVVSTEFDAKDIAKTLSKHFDSVKMENKEEDGVWVDFSHMGQYGANKTMEFLKCPKWDDIKGNYSKPVSEGITRLVGIKDPWAYGRLLIWNGNPGTGKTFAVRSLMMQWRKQFDFLVITDPERLAADPSYYYSVASEVRERPASAYGGDPDDIMFEDDIERSKKRLLFILEDSADLILQESRSSHYDKVGKLLNMTDGLFGQGREDLFLITFNEEVDRIDPAFLRPGRCISNIEFTPFQADEATAWISAHGGSYKPRGEMTLAQMYSKVLAEKGDGPISVRPDKSTELLMKPKPKSTFGERVS